MEWLNIKAPILWAFTGLFALLLIASVTTRIIGMINSDKDYSELRARVNSWWIMVTIIALALVLEFHLAIIFFAFLSFLALKEYLSLIPTRRADRRVLFWAYLAIPFQYLWIMIGWYGMFIIFIPVYIFLYLPMRMVLVGETKDFLRAAGTIHWGLMTMVFSLGHIAYLLVLPEDRNPAAGGAGLVLYLIFLTQANDISQYIWGKSFGKHRISPKVSPNKTWQGFLGGVATTTVLAFILAPWFTPLSSLHAILAGLIISISGFIGDLTISALKRDLGVKDSGSLIPGHGGILDRIDSLTYSAPLFFHFIYYLYY